MVVIDSDRGRLFCFGPGYHESLHLRLGLYGNCS